MPTVTQPRNISTTRPPEPRPTELLEEVADLSSGLGLGFMSFLGAIPGLLPCVALTVAALVIVAIPMVIVGVAAGAVYLVLRAIAGLARRASSLLGPPAPEPSRPEPDLAAPDNPHRGEARMGRLRRA